MAKPELGMKRQCQSCAAKFFDLNKNPIVCPKCGAVFTAAAPTRAPARAQAVEEDEAAPAAAGPEIVSLEEADAPEKAVEGAEDDIDIDEEAGGDEAFLEEDEEDDDDVSGLIDGEIENDEES